MARPNRTILLWIALSTLFAGIIIATQASVQMGRALAAPNGTVTLVPIKDTWLNGNETDKNYGACDILELDTSAGGLGKGRPLLQFDLASIPAGATITSAQLQLTKVGGDTVNHNVEVRRVTAAWDEGVGNCVGVSGAASWGFRQTGVSWSASGGDFDSSPVDTIVVNADGVYTWDVTTRAQQWLDNSQPNYGLILGSTDTGTDQYQFASGENGVNADRPQLLITYSGGAPPTVEGVLWQDSDRDGVRDGGESGIQDVAVNLYNGACHEASALPIDVATTAVDGSYSFTVTDQQSYCIFVKPGTLPADMAITTGNVPADAVVDGSTVQIDVGYASIFATDRLAVSTYAPCSDVSWLQTFATNHSASFLRQDFSACSFTLDVPPANMTALRSAVLGDRRVLSAGPDVYTGGALVPNDPDYSNPGKVFGPQQINIEKAWDVTTGDPGLIAAVLDTGIDASHPEFSGRVLAGYDFVNDDSDPADDHGHGTHVAGIMAAGINNGIGMAGIAGDVQILPLKVLNDKNTGWWSDVSAAITYGVDQGAKVLNLSITGSSGSSALRSAIAYANSKGATVVVAAGNDGVKEVRYPASYDEAIAVGAIDYSGGRWSLSNYGPNVDVTAPGQFIHSTYPGGGYQFLTGTSMATPHVAGVAALLYSVNPNLTSAEVKDVLQSTAVDLGAAGVDQYYGYGRIDAGAAVAAVPAGVAMPPNTDLGVTLATDADGNGLVDPGDILRYAILAANDSPAPLANVVVSSTIPSNASYVPGSTRFNGIPVLDNLAPATVFPLDEGGLNIGNVPANDSTILTYDVVVGASAQGTYEVVTNAVVTSEAGTEHLRVETEVAGTLLMLTVDRANAIRGETLSYTIDSDYLRAELLQNVVITAAVPAGASYVLDSANAGGSESGGAVIWDLGSNMVGAPGYATGSPPTVNTVNPMASSDTWLWVSKPNESHGTDGTLFGNPRVEDYEPVLVRFDLAAIPAGSTITSAILNMYVVVASDGHTVNVHPMLTSWTESTATYNDSDGAGPDDWSTGLFSAADYAGTPLGSIIPNTTGHKTLDITGQVDDWVNKGIPNHGLVLAPIGTTAPAVQYASREYATLGRRPKLSVTYMLPDAVPSTGNAITIAPTLVTAGSQITVSMTLTASENVVRVAPSLIFTGANGIATSPISGPTPVSADVDPLGTTFTWVYDVTASGNIGQITFGGDASDGTITWPWARSNSVIVHPPLTFDVTVNDPPGISNVRTTALINDSSGFLPSHASNTTATLLPASIGDRIWNDADGDRIQDPGEFGIGSVTVQLTDSDGGTISQVTGVDGEYDFTGLATGAYTITVDVATVPAAYEFLTTQNPLLVAVGDGEDYDVADFGFKARSSSIGDSVWYDADGDGLQDPGEPGIGNITLDLWLDDGDGTFEPVQQPGADTYVGWTTSNAAGAYRLGAPVDGNYFVAVTDDYGLLSQLVHTIGPQSMSDPSPPVPLVAGQVVQNVDFSYVRTPGSGNAVIGDLLWADGDSNGQRTLDEPVLVGVQVCATPTAGGSDICATTDLNGRYLLIVPPGEYDITPVNPPVGLLPTTPSPHTVNVLGGEQYLDADFGYGPDGAALGHIGGQIWQDLPVNDAVDGLYDGLNEPGIPGVSADLIVDLNNDGDWDEGEPYVAVVSGLGGKYWFEGLLPGSYLVKVSDTLATLRNFAPTILPTGGSSVTDGVNKDQPYPVALGASESDATADFGYREYEVAGAGDPPNPGMIGNLVWVDANGDGSYRPTDGDQPMPGVTLRLTDLDNGGQHQATTGLDGIYLFSDLPLGNYSVAVSDDFGVLSAYAETVAGPDNHAQPYNITLPFFAPSDLSGDFGYVRLPDGAPGDCNMDETVNAGDISALVLEIFDGDGVIPANAAGGSFTGHAVGCDANGDAAINAGDISCTVLTIFNGPGACSLATNAAQSADAKRTAAPALSMPTRVESQPGALVEVPIALADGVFTDGAGINSLAFAVDFDATQLHFDPRDDNGDSLPDAVSFDLPAGFIPSARYDPTDGGGKLDIAIVSATPGNTLPDGVLARLHFAADASAKGREIAVRFAADPPPSFGATGGQARAGTRNDGSVLIVADDGMTVPGNGAGQFVYLPLVNR